MKVREIITIKCWQDGSGYQYTETYGDKIIDIPESYDPDWSWWECEDRPDDQDIEITVAFYPADCDDISDVEPLSSWSVWESELREED